MPSDLTYILTAAAADVISGDLTLNVLVQVISPAAKTIPLKRSLKKGELPGKGEYLIRQRGKPYAVSVAEAHQLHRKNTKKLIKTGLKMAGAFLLINGAILAGAHIAGKYIVGKEKAANIVNNAKRVYDYADLAIEA